MPTTRKPTTICPLLNSSLVKAKTMAYDFPDDWSDFLNYYKVVTPQDNDYLDFYIEMTKGEMNV